MPVEALDHIYVETRDWDAGVDFWHGLGFSFSERWGSDGHRAGRLVAGSAAVVLAEVGAESKPEFSVFFPLTDADTFAPGSGVDVETELSPTHWGTRWLRVRDGEGRIYSLEETGD